MIYATIHAPSLIEPGSTVELFARAFATDAPFSALAVNWSQTAGAAGVLETFPASARFTAPVGAAGGDTFTINLEVTVGPETVSVNTRLTCIPLIGKDIISLRALVDPGTTLMPRGDWFYDLDLTALDSNPATLRSLCPARLFTRMTVGNAISMVPTVVQRLFLNRWRVHVPAVAAGETLVELVTEQVPVQFDPAGPFLTLRRPAESLHLVLWQVDGAADELVPAPWTSLSPGSVTVRLSPALQPRFDAGKTGLFQVRYYSVAAEERAGWYVGLGLGPNDSAAASLLTVYGEGPYVDPTLDVSGNTWNVTREASHTVAVQLAGRQALQPYYHLWKRDGAGVLLREPYEGILAE